MPDVYDDNGQLVKQQVYGDDGRPVLATSASNTGPYLKPGELHRKDTSMFDINYEPTYNKISDWASHLPRGLQSIGAYPLSLSVSAMQGVTDALSQPETPAMMLGGWLKGAISPTKELAEIPRPVLPASRLMDTNTPLYHGTSEANIGTLQTTGKFDPNAGLINHPKYGNINPNRQYDYSVGGPDTTYLTKEKDTWLNSDFANASRAVTYDTHVNAKLTPDAHVATVNSMDELNKLVQEAGFSDAHDFANKISVDGLRSGNSSPEIRNARRAVDQFKSRTGYDGIDLNFDENVNWDDDTIPFDDKQKASNPFGGRQVMMFDSSKVNPVTQRVAAPTFIGGQSGASGQVVPAEEAAKNPLNYVKVIGKGSTPAAKAIDLAEIQEAQRLAKLKYTGAEQNPGSALKITDKGYSLPLESGDTTGGFTAETGRDMAWPYNTIPNRLRPRAAQTKVLSNTGLKGMDLSAPAETEPITFSSGGTENPPLPTETPNTATGTGQPTELLGKNSRLPIGKMAYNDDGELIHPPSLDSINAQPRVATPNNLGDVPPGQADVPPKHDISGFRAEFSSPQVVGENFPQSRGVIDPIMKANDEKYKWLATTQREFAQISSGLNRGERQQLMHILNGDEVPDVAPNVAQAASRAKDMLDGVYDMANDKSGDIGFIDHYITHIEKQPDDFKSAVASIVDHQFGQKSGLYQIFSSGNLEKATGDVGDLYEKGIGSPTSNFIKHRSDIVDPIETDYDKIIPTYLESIAKVIFDRPATDEAKEALKQLPVGKLKEWAQGYIKNYTKYDADAELSKAWNSLANQIATTNARSAISFNPLVHAYHAGQLPANIWPELGTKYSAQGMAQFLQHPIESYQELAKNGLFTNQIRPMQFQTPMQKFDSIAYYMNMVESMVKGTGYYGFKARALDAGLSEADATMRAIAETKNATATVDPARAMRYFTPESNVLGGEVGRLAKQYHQIPTKLVENFARAMADFKAQPAKAARYIAGSTLAGAGSAVGLHTLHVNPLTLAGSYLGGAGQFGSVMTSALRNLKNQNLGAALGDIAEWATPGGATIKKGIKFVSGQ